jgi:hypothetical protein
MTETGVRCWTPHAGPLSLFEPSVMSKPVSMVVMNQRFYAAETLGLAIEILATHECESRIRLRIATDEALRFVDRRGMPVRFRRRA